MENYQELLLKYLQNECTHNEMQSILNWLKDPKNEYLFEQFIKEDCFHFESIDTKEAFVNNTAFEIVKQRINSGKINKDKHKIRKIVFRIAASFLLPIAIGYSTFYFFHTNAKPEPIAFNEITAPLGSKTNITLGDGTKVWLNSGSKLKIPQKFEGDFREVQLIGEAYFDVKKDAHRPFIVRTSKLNIKVLGTSFNVKAYPEEGTIETTLVNGLVTITKSSESLNSKNVTYLKPKQRATFVKESGKLILTESEKELIKQEVKVKVDQTREEKMICTKNIDTEQFVAWKDDKLVFKYEDFESLCIKLKRWYGVEINIKSEQLKKYHYTGVLQKETINDVIEMLKLTMPFRYEINHSVIDLWSEKENKADKI